MEREVRSANAALADAVSRGDSIAVADLYSADARLLAPGGELLAGRSEIEAYWRAGIALGVSRLELVSLELELGDATAVEVGRYAVSVRAEHRPMTVHRGLYLVVFGQQGRRTWQRALEAFSAGTRSAPAREVAPARRAGARDDSGCAARASG